MRLPRHPVRTAALLLIALIIFAGILAPMFSAGAFKRPIQRSLEQGLQRKVEINGKVVFNLFTGPGFSVGDVLIYEDPRAGIEPFASVEWVEARVRLTSLLRGRLEFSRLRLESPTVNLVKIDAGGWNIQQFLDRTAAATSAEAARLPAIQVRDGRLNFKFGDTKSVFYMTNADVDVSPGSQGEDVSVAFEGQPARTDRPAVGFGRFTGRGQWKPSASGEGQLAVNVQLEKSNIADISTLLYGRDAGLHGIVSSSARIAGPLSGLKIEGQIQVADIHRWDLLPGRGEGFPIDYSGSIDLRAQSVRIETVQPKSGAAPVAIRFLARGIMSRPQWEAGVTLTGVPLASLAEAALHMGTPLPAGIAMDGKVDGTFSYSPLEGPRGEVRIAKASLQAPDSEAIRVEEANVSLAPEGIDLLPADIEIGKDRKAQVEAAYSFENHALVVKITGRALRVREFAKQASQVLNAPPVPLLEQFQDGIWSGAVRYRVAGEEKGQWSGAVELRDAVVSLPDLADPLRISSAAANLDGTRVVLNRVQARAGKTRFDGDYRYIPDAARPHRFRINIPQADAAELERLLAPALRRRQNFFERALRIGNAPVPDWLKGRHAEGLIRITTLKAVGTAVGPVRAAFSWDGTGAELDGIEAHYEDAVLTGTLDIDLAGNTPAYSLDAELKGLPWKGGTVEAAARVDTGGSGIALLSNLKAEGTFRGQAIGLDPENPFRNLSGDYRLSVARGVPRLVISGLQASLGADTYSGQGATLADGRLQCDLTSPQKQLRIAGTLVPLKIEVTR